jgi:hypothetical protein
MAEEIYRNVSGAYEHFFPDLGIQWVVPCDAEIDLTFKFGGVDFPIHPLDMNLDNLIRDDHGNVVCIGGVSLTSDERHD